MSDYIVRYFPADRFFQPSQQIADKAALFLEAVLGAPVTYDLYDKMAFIDGGETFGDIHCPQCGKKLDVEWWSDEMSESYEKSHFHRLDITTPCCGVNTTLDQLNYEFPVSFGRFLLNVENPDELLSNKPEQFAELEILVGGNLREIVARI
ncbi:hypothetical protein [Pectobacterium sp. B1J-3]|uniref:hypothetical protein n=1 Tax=Pectobacterium sp. B1J-3 TaxID=3385371 RepID=UPI003906ABEB